MVIPTSFVLAAGRTSRLAVVGGGGLRRAYGGGRIAVVVANAAASSPTPSSPLGSLGAIGPNATAAAIRAHRQQRRGLSGAAGNNKDVNGTTNNRRVKLGEQEVDLEVREVEEGATGPSGVERKTTEEGDVDRGKFTHEVKVVMPELGETEDGTCIIQDRSGSPSVAPHSLNAIG